MPLLLTSDHLPLTLKEVCMRYDNILALFSIGPTEWVVIGLVALLIFGRNLPSVARSLGKSVIEFKKGLKGIDDEVENVNDQIDKEIDRHKSFEKESGSQK